MIQKDALKADLEQAHDKELAIIKEKLRTKVEVEKYRITEENDTLLEQSGDIENSLKHFSGEIYGVRMEQDRIEIKNE